MLDRIRIFYQYGVRDLNELVSLAYDLAWFWKVDPQLMLRRDLDELSEAYGHAQRINAATRVE